MPLFSHVTCLKLHLNILIVLKSFAYLAFYIFAARSLFGK